MIATMKPWVGCKIPSERILILGESWYGPLDLLSEYLMGWCKGSVRDYLFSRIFNAASGFHTETASIDQRTGFWNSVLFDNFINFSVGPTRECRPNATHFKAAACSFQKRLDELHPHAVWVLGKEQARYSVPILEKDNYPHVVSSHPCGRGVTTKSLTEAWAEVTKRSL